MAVNFQKSFVQRNSFLHAVVFSIILSSINFKAQATNEHTDKLINLNNDKEGNQNNENNLNNIIHNSNNNNQLIERLLHENEPKTLNSLENDQLNRPSSPSGLFRVNKRSWQNLQGSWGKRDSLNKNRIDDEVIGVDGLSNGGSSVSGLRGYENPERPLADDEFDDLLLLLSRQEQQQPNQPFYNSRDILDMLRMPQHNDNADNLASPQKRAWKNLNTGWGKRVAYKNQNRNYNGRHGRLITS